MGSAGSRSYAWAMSHITQSLPFVCIYLFPTKYQRILLAKYRWPALMVRSKLLLFSSQLRSECYDLCGEGWGFAPCFQKLLHMLEHPVYLSSCHYELRKIIFSHLGLNYEGVLGNSGSDFKQKWKALGVTYVISALEMNFRFKQGHSRRI